MIYTYVCVPAAKLHNKEQKCIPSVITILKLAHIPQSSTGVFPHLILPSFGHPVSCLQTYTKQLSKCTMMDISQEAWVHFIWPYSHSCQNYVNWMMWFNPWSLYSAVQLRFILKCFQQVLQQVMKTFFA